MSAGAVLRDGRLHLHHGPIDLIIGVEGADEAACYRAASDRFAGLLDRLVSELPGLRKPLQTHAFKGAVAQRMARAVAAHGEVFVTPMAAVAGAVADEILSAIRAEHSPSKVYVNNGGDIAFHLAGGAVFTALGPSGPITVTAKEPARGLATSGWGGRSHSLGIADAVTALARTAAAADVAATLIANAVDLPGHPAITRRAARDLSPESDLGPRPVTTDVGPLSRVDIDLALARGAATAQTMIDRGDILQASLALQGQTRILTAKGMLADA